MHDHAEYKNYTLRSALLKSDKVNADGDEDASVESNMAQTTVVGSASPIGASPQDQRMTSACSGDAVSGRRGAREPREGGHGGRGCHVDFCEWY